MNNQLEKAVVLEKESKEKIRKEILKDYIIEETCAFPTKKVSIGFNWKKLYNKATELNYDEEYEKFFNNSLKILEEKGTLVRNKIGSYLLLGNGMDLSPSTSWGATYYFTKESEAHSYAQAYFNNTSFSVHICELKGMFANRKDKK